MSNGADEPTDNNAKDRSTLDRLSLRLDEGARDLNLKQLYYFHAVASEGTIARAAKKLKVSAATVSEQLRNLEEYLEQPLVERRRTGVRLNTHGRRVFEHTKTMFRSVRRLLQEISPNRVRDRWVLEIGLCPTISRTFAADRFMPLFEIREMAPKIRHGTYEDLIEHLQRREIDIVLSENRPPEIERSGIGLRKLSESSLVFVATPQLAERVESFPEGLSKLPFITYSSGSHYRWKVENYFAEHSIAPEILGEVDDVALLLTAACRGLCCAVLPRSAIEYDLNAQQLEILGELPGSETGVYAHYASIQTADVVKRAIDVLYGE